MKPEITKQLIVKLYNKNLTIKKIAEISDCSPTTVESILKKEKVRMRGKHCTRIDRSELVNLPIDYVSGKYKVKELKKKYNIKSNESLYKILDEFGVSRKQPNYKKYKTI
jgi:transposase